MEVPMRTDLIFSRRHDNGFLSIEEAAAKAPAAFTTGHADSLSGIYGEVDTNNVIDIMRDYGFGITQAAQKKSRKASDLPYAEHLLAFQSPELNRMFNPENRPEIVVYNSRNGLSSLKLFTGCFRFICSNGMIAGEGMMQKVRHTKTRVVGVEDAIVHSIENLPLVMSQIDRFKSIQMDTHGLLAFAEKAAALRWSTVRNKAEIENDARGSFADDRTVQQMAFTAYRAADNRMDLWTSLNRVQERLIRGGVDIVSVTDKAPHGKMRVASPIRSVAESVRVNRDIWQIAEEFAEAA
jgi:hypothetical protein